MTTPIIKQPIRQSESQLLQIALQHHQAGRFPDAKNIYRQILHLNPDHPDALHLLGALYHQTGNNQTAVEYICRALKIDQSNPFIYNNLGAAYQALFRFDDAVNCFHKALALEPGYAEGYFNLGNVLNKQRQLDQAVTCYRKALSLKPDYVDAHISLGNTYKDLNRPGDAIACYLKALALNPDYAEIYFNLGVVFNEQGNLDEAIDYFHKALSLKPDYPFAIGMCLKSQMNGCDWEGIDDVFRKTLSAIDAGKAASHPFTVLPIPSTPAQQKRCAEIYTREIYPETPNTLGSIPRYSHDKIRIGYFSADFHNHPCSYLMAGLFEEHDRSRFEVTAFSFGPDKNDDMRKRVAAAFDKFVDVRNLSDKDIALLSRSHEIDIAVDRKGYTTNCRTGIFALRAAPIQVSYLAYPGSMGAAYIDYLIADRTLIPEASQQYYTEKIAYLPYSYQANDAKRAIAGKAFTREEMGLPSAGFVFCCFNNNFKITPAIFDIWMQLLKQVEGSVLWLLECNAQAGQNLRNEASKRGVAPERLVFARRMDLPEHLARHRLADLFLDTFYYNAHTTASDSLWAGVPVLTCLGDTFAGRVAASLLNAVGLPELITRSPDEYHALALQLATNPEHLASIRQKLARNRLTHPLFDTTLFTRHIEDAFTRMWKRYQESLVPDHIYVATEFGNKMKL